MVTKYVKEPLGMGRGAGTERDILASRIGVVSPKMWIDLAIMGAISLASSIIGGIQAAKAAKESKNRQKKLEADEDSWYNLRYNENYIDAAAGRNLVRRARDHAREQWKRAAGAQAVTGGTEAATAMSKEAGNKMVGDTIADIAARDQERKDSVDGMHRQAQVKFAQMDMNRELQRAQNITNAAGAASNAIMSAGSAIEQGSAKAPSLQGGSNNSTPVIDPAVHESNLSVKPSDIQPFSHTNDDLLARMGRQVRGKIGV